MAQERLAVLQRGEAAEFARAVEQAQAAVPEEGYLLKLERASSAQVVHYGYVSTTALPT